MRRVDEVQQTNEYWLLWSSIPEQPETNQFLSWYPKDEYTKEQAIQEETEL